METLVLIANNEEAVFLSLQGKTFAEVQRFTHPQAREKAAQLVTDRPGRSFSSSSPTRYALNEGQDLYDVERKKFALELVNFCDQRDHSSRYRELWLVTGPKLLGDLRSLLHKARFLKHPIRVFHKELPFYESVKEQVNRIHKWLADGDFSFETALSGKSP